MALQENILDCGSEQVEHWFLCNYKPFVAGLDNLSRSLIRFKNCSTIDLRAWTECSVEALLPRLQNQHVTVIRALGSEERLGPAILDPDRNALDYLGMQLAIALNCPYNPSLLSKIKMPRPLKGLTLQERRQETSNAFLFSQSKTPSTSLLIIDDILTTGSTMRAIINAIRQVNACPIYVYTLAMTDRNVVSNPVIPLETQHYQWRQVAGWAAREPVSLYGNLAGLKALILNDFYQG
jgi:hypothetical protein